MPREIDEASIRMAQSMPGIYATFQDIPMLSEEEARAARLSGFQAHMERILDGSVPKESMMQTTPTSPSLPSLTALDHAQQQAEEERDALLARKLSEAQTAPGGISHWTDAEADSLLPTRQMPAPHADGDPFDS